MMLFMTDFVGMHVRVWLITGPFLFYIATWPGILSANERSGLEVKISY